MRGDRSRHDRETHCRQFCRRRSLPRAAVLLGCSRPGRRHGPRLDRHFRVAVSYVPQVSIATEGGSGTPVPDLSVEVDDLDEALRRVRDAGLAIEYGPATEPWGVRRFYVRDPFGRLVNILAHASPCRA